MRVWTRAVLSVKCGLCPGVIPVGAPLQVVTIAGIKKKRYRCQFCAGGDVPPDLPARVVTADPPAPLAMTKFRPDMLPIDYKRVASGEREPGEDDA